MPGYSLLMPPPWARIHLEGDLPDQVRSAVLRATAGAPAALPPDQVGPVRRRFEAQLTAQLTAARDRGAIDFYLPLGELHGTQLNASFTVSGVMPSSLDSEVDVGSVLAELLSDGSEPVEAGGTVWARSDRVVRSEPDDTVRDSAQARKVEYVTADPRDRRRWILVTFTTFGDGQPDSDFTHLVVELFDAIMTTWRWDDDVPTAN